MIYKQNEAVGVLMSDENQHLEKVREIGLEYFQEKNLMILPAYRGFLIAGKSRTIGHPLVMWLHKANVEGLSKIVVTTAVEMALDTVASLIPFGTMGYAFIRDTLQLKMPRDVHVFVPDTHYMETGSLTISSDGEVFEGPIGGFVTLTKRTLSVVGKTVTSGVKGFLNVTGLGKKDKSPTVTQESSTSSDRKITIVIFRFPPKFLQRYLSVAEESLTETAKTFLHSVPVPEFRVTDVDAARLFLDHVKRMGFYVEQSSVFRPFTLPKMLGTKNENKK